MAEQQGKEREMEVMILHENSEWLKGLKDALDRKGIRWWEWHVEKGIVLGGGGGGGEGGGKEEGERVKEELMKGERKGTVVVSRGSASSGSRDHLSSLSLFPLLLSLFHHHNYLVLVPLLSSLLSSFALIDSHPPFLTILLDMDVWPWMNHDRMG